MSSLMSASINMPKKRNITLMCANELNSNAIPCLQVNMSKVTLNKTCCVKGGSASLL